MPQVEDYIGEMMSTTQPLFAGCKFQKYVQGKTFQSDDLEITGIVA